MLIMYVDDDRAPREAITSMLEALGHTVDTFNDPRAALYHYRTTTTKYDLVVTDYHMPMLTGVELAGQIRVINDKQPILVVSGDPEFVNRVLKKIPITHFVDKVLGKPFHLKDLADAIHEVCGG